MGGHGKQGRTFRVAGLFAGIGGLELGLERAGHHTELLCENDAAADLVLAERFAGAKRCRDVRDLGPRSLTRDLDLIAAGFPCQDLSQAGALAGIGGARSSLVGEVFRLLRARRVPWVLLENVPFMLHLDRGRAMELVLGTLEALGYRWAYRVVDAQAFGLPQRRRRVFFVASTEGNPAEVLLADHAKVPDEKEWDPSRAVGFYWTEGNRGVGWAVDSIPTLKGGSGIGIPSAPAVLLPDGRLVTPSIGGTERLQGFPRGWTRSAPARSRWRMVGNAVNVRVAKWIGERLASPRTLGAAVRMAPLTKGRWPSAACNLGDGRMAVEVGEWPQRTKLTPIESYLDGANPLSARATEGFVLRAERAVTLGKLRFPEGFLSSLRAHLLRLQECKAGSCP